MINKQGNKGISLVVLIVTIVILLIIVSTVIISTGNSISNTKLTTFSEELALVEDQVKVYYIQNNEFPLKDGATAMSQSEVISLAKYNQEFETAFRDELTSNGDIQIDDSLGEFYPIDISKLDVNNVQRGIGVEGDSDIYVVSYPSMNVYYLKGLKLNTGIYFSLSNNLNGVLNLQTVSKDTSVTTVQKSDSLTVKSDNKTWSNKLGIRVQAMLESDEEIYINITGITGSKKINTITGVNNFRFEKLSDLKTVTNLTDDEINTFNALTITDKNIEFIKKKATVTISSVKVDLSKYEAIPPTLEGTLYVVAKDTENIGTFKVSDNINGSGIKEVRYDYLTKFDTNGQIVNYYEGVTDFDVSYLRTKGKKVNISSNGNAQIRIPKDVESIQILIQDNAGNWTKTIQSVRTLVYVGYSLNTMNTTQVDFNLIINNINGISSVTTSLSLDGGKTYTNLEDYSSSIKGNISIINCNRYQNIYGIKDSVYIKAVVVDNNATVANRVTETRIFKLSIIDNTLNIGNAPVLATGMTPVKWDGNTWVATTTSDNGWYNYKMKQWANAQTADGSMWVWIPRYEYKISNPHTSTSQTIAINFLNGASTAATIGYTVHPAFTFGSTQLTGIWVAKFEASGTTSTIKSKPNVTPLVNITIGEMFTACRNMETSNGSQYGWGTSGTGIDTHQMKNVEWGAVAYLSSSIYGKNGEVWINPNNNYTTGQAGTNASASGTTSTYPFDNAAYGVNASTTGNIYGIYDMSGGVWEYTAAYVNNGNAALTTNGSSLVNAANQYKDVYTSNGNTTSGNYLAASSKIGDAVYETSNTDTGTMSWYSDYSYMPFTSVPFFVRGGYCGDMTAAGIFAFSSYGGNAVTVFGFRPCLIVSPSL